MASSRRDSTILTNRQSMTSSIDEDDRATLASPRVLDLQGRSDPRLSGCWSINTGNRASTHSNTFEAQIGVSPDFISDPLPKEAQDTTPIFNIKVEALSPAPQGEKKLCRIVRRKDPGLPTRYDFYREDNNFTTTFMLSAYRKRRGRGSYYVITTKKQAGHEEVILGKVKSNFIGTQFTIYDNGVSPSKYRKKNRILPNVSKTKDNEDLKLRQELGSVFYDPNILGFKGPRKMTVLLMGMTKDGKRPEFRPSSEEESLAEKYQSGTDSRLLVLRNKSPQWNEETQSYVLNFSGRVTLASVKNFQIVHTSDLDYIVLQFGRIAETTFTLDYQYPLCPLQAFAIALSSFDAKLACE